MFDQIPSVTALQFALWLAHRSGPKRAARGGRAMDAKTSESGHLMLITPERVFYAGLLGRPRERCPGALHVYVALKGGLWLTTADGGDRHGELLAVMPNVRHTIASEHRSAICLVIEPESVRPGTFEELVKRLSGPEAEIFAARVRAAYATLRERRYGDDITSAEFDIRCFGEALPRRARPSRSPAPAGSRGARPRPPPIAGGRKKPADARRTLARH